MWQAVTFLYTGLKKILCRQTWLIRSRQRDFFDENLQKAAAKNAANVSGTPINGCAPLPLSEVQV
jgi:hypothetical protein